MSSVESKSPHVLILSTSLNAHSKSRILAEHTLARLEGLKISSTFLSLRDLPLPLCDGTKEISHHPNAVKLREEMRKATHIVFAMPIYNFSVNSAAKNVIELIYNWACWYDDEWDDDVMGKTAGFICTGGAEHSHMAVLPFANTLMMECWWWIAPRYVYATGTDFKDGSIANPQVFIRIDRMLRQMLNGPRFCCSVDIPA